MSKKNLMPLAVILACTAAACAPASPVFDQQFGGSVRTLKAQQVATRTHPLQIETNCRMELMAVRHVKASNVIRAALARRRQATTRLRSA